MSVDVKKRGKGPVGGGWRMVGRTAGNRNSFADKGDGRRNGDPLRGHPFLHAAIEGHSRLAYSELRGDERKETAPAFWSPATRRPTNLASRCEKC